MDIFYKPNYTATSKKSERGRFNSLSVRKYICYAAINVDGFKRKLSALYVWYVIVLDIPVTVSTLTYVV